MSSRIKSSFYLTLFHFANIKTSHQQHNANQIKSNYLWNFKQQNSVRKFAKTQTKCANRINGQLLLMSNYNIEFVVQFSWVNAVARQLQTLMQSEVKFNVL